MIIFKDNKLDVETPKEIKLDGVYYGIIMHTEYYDDTSWVCYVYIPEIYGKLDVNNTNIFNYPSIIVPNKQDIDDVGHKPQVGELIKVSFDDGNVNGGRFMLLVPIGEEQILRNKLYIEKGIISTNINDTIDSSVINKMKQILKYIYYITIGKYDSNNTNFKLKYLLSRNKTILNYFVEPLLMPLTSNYTDDLVGGKDLQEINFPIFSSTNYMLYNVIRELFNDSSTVSNVIEDLLNIFNAFIDNNAYYIKNPFGNNKEQKVYATAAIISGISPNYVRIAFPSTFDGVIEWGSAGGDVFTWQEFYFEFEKYIVSSSNIANFLNKSYVKKAYENEWGKMCATYLSSVKSKMLVQQTNDNGIDIIATICLNLCPWMAIAFLGYDISTANIVENLLDIYPEAANIYKSLYNMENRSYNVLFNDDESFTDAIVKINSALNKGDILNFIQVFEDTSRDCFYEFDKKSTSSTLENYSWNSNDMEIKFARLKGCYQEIINEYNKESTITVTSPSYFSSVPLSKDIQSFAYQECLKYNLSYELLLGLIETESGFNPNAISSTNDYGLCQINKGNFTSLTNILGVTNFLDPYQNIQCGTYLLSSAMNTANNNIEKALMVYNQGPAGAKAFWNQGIYSTNYSKKVMNNYRKYLN